MKTRLLLPIVLVALSLVPTFGQQGLNLPSSSPRPQEPPIRTKFSLDFHGGTPEQLVTAIEKAMGKPLNVIIPAEHADFKLPPLKMSNVDVAQLFLALEATSRKTESYNPPGTVGFLQQLPTSYGFRTPNMNWASDDSIWYFFVEKPSAPLQAVPAVQKVCKFYPLTSYLERGLTVDDITTAIQTGWKMLGEKGTPTISFHKETKLLIAVGEPDKLETIDAVLRALGPMAFSGSTLILNPNIQTPQSITLPPARPATPKPTQKPKTEN